MRPCDSKLHNSIHKFQSTHPHGVRLEQGFRNNIVLDISIHAPARGATCISLFRTSMYRLFQSTHPHGVRQSLAFYHRWCGRAFQSTHPHGVRREDYDTFVFPNGFQSTHPHGVRRSESLSNEERGKVFQSTHPHGVRRFQIAAFFWPHADFNPRTRTGCDGLSSTN